MLGWPMTASSSLVTGRSGYVPSVIPAFTASLNSGANYFDGCASFLYEALRIIGQLLKDNVRKGDIVARYGGEEFIVCYLNAYNPAEVAAIAERFRKKVEDYIVEVEETQPGGKLTVSMGISLLSRNKTLDDLIREANKGLYESKHHGRNQITLFKP
jgi:diguanylate cyclase (GGDEF)-like protein